MECILHHVNLSYIEIQGNINKSSKFLDCLKNLYYYIHFFPDLKLYNYGIFQNYCIINEVLVCYNRFY